MLNVRAQQNGRYKEGDTELNSTPSCPCKSGTAAHLGYLTNQAVMFKGDNGPLSLCVQATTIVRGLLKAT